MCLGWQRDRHFGAAPTERFLEKRTQRLGIARGSRLPGLDEVTPQLLGATARAPEARGLFQEIGGVGNAFGGCRHLGGDLTGAGGTLRSEDGAQIGDQ